MSSKCKVIRELILTDYIDNEMDDKRKTSLNIHFARCAECRDFYEQVTEVVVKPFAGADRLSIPESIWQNINQAIAAKQQKETGFLAGLFRKLKSFTSIPKPAFAISTVMALVLIAGVAVKFRLDSREAPEKAAQGQMEYYSAYLTEIPLGMLVNDEAGLGTSIEEYFL